MFEGIKAHDKSGTEIIGTVKKQELTVTPSDSVQTFQEDDIVYSSVTVEAAESSGGNDLPLGFWDKENYSELYSIAIPEGVKILTNNAFYQRTYLKNVTLPSGILKIGHDAFSDCVNLINIDIPDSCNEIGSFTFYNCSLLEGISLPKALETVQTSLCAYNTNLQYALIKENVTQINGMAFISCKGLKYISCLAVNPPTLISINAFSNTNDCPIYVPDDSVDNYKAASNWSDYADRIKPLSEFTE
jgi:hypothetical protein